MLHEFDIYLPQTEKCKAMLFEKLNISDQVIVISKTKLICSNMLCYFSSQFHYNCKNLSMCPVLTIHFKVLSLKCYDIGFGTRDSFHRQRLNEKASKHFKT